MKQAEFDKLQTMNLYQCVAVIIPYRSCNMIYVLMLYCENCFSKTIGKDIVEGIEEQSRKTEKERERKEKSTKQPTCD